MRKDAGKPTASAPALANDQPDAMRAELLRLRRDLDQVQREFDDTHAAQLMQANEQLVLAALQAESIAETAMLKLSELTSATQRNPLADTSNRALMLDRLTHAIAMAKRRHTRIALLFVDVDHFKQINDTLGHAVGDEVLQTVAHRLQAAVRDSDTVSRHSSDEFLVLLAEISQPSDAALIATKMLVSVAASLEAGAQQVQLSVSVGIAIYPEDGDNPEGLVGRADAAMCRAKGRGGGGFEFHSSPASGDGAKPSSDVRPVAGTPTMSEHAHGADLQDSRNLRDANEQLILSSVALHESEARAVQAHQQQVKFLAIVAHELRNPLTPIRTAAEMLNRVRADDEQHARLQEMIKRQVAHMARIVDDLLDGSSVSLGKFHLEFAAVDLAEILNLAVDSCRPRMDAKLQRLRTQLPNSPLLVQGDPVRLAQVFRNLLENSSKYTPKGGAISLTAVVGHDAVVITVADNGIGIASEAVPHVFDLFVQDARAVAVHSGGLGIGLAVVRELVEAHGGAVVAKSAGHDLGSNFVVTLPRLTTPACVRA